MDNGPGDRRRKVEFGSVSIPNRVLRDVDDLIRRIGYWPSRSAFVREAVIEKIRRERERLRGAGEDERGVQPR